MYLRVRGPLDLRAGNWRIMSRVPADAGAALSVVATDETLNARSPATSEIIILLTL
jgi:hypothetical protein